MTQQWIDAAAESAVPDEDVIAVQVAGKEVALYGVDGDHNGRLDPWSPADAIYTAARYLCSNGAGTPAGVQQALLRYNNAQWYVDLVLKHKVAPSPSSLEKDDQRIEREHPVHRGQVRHV